MSSPASKTILLISCAGEIRESKIKNYLEEDLYKKCGFKSAVDFACLATWTVNDREYKCYGKTKGKHDSVQKYEFPPPIDTTLLFGTCVIVCPTHDVTCALWQQVYDQLFGGFEDLEESQKEDDECRSQDEEDGEEAEEADRTVDGYLKDGFVVSDEEEDDNGDEELNEEEYLLEEEDVAVPPKNFRQVLEAVHEP